MGDLKSKPLIVLKGGLFLLCAVLSAGLLFQEAPSFRTLLLLGLLVWASARFYYFLFYVLQTYVDPTLKYSGLLAQVRALWRRKAATPAPRPSPSTPDPTPAP